MHHPIQPVEVDSNGVKRFKGNAIVIYLLKRGGISLNDLAELDFNNEDWQQFAQLIGYSLSGYGELSYVSSDAYGAAITMAEDGLSEDKARIAYLENELFHLRAELRGPMARLFDVHPDDLKG